MGLTLYWHHWAHLLQSNPSSVGSYVLSIFLRQLLLKEWIYEWIAPLNQLTSLKFIDPINKDGCGGMCSWVMKTGWLCLLKLAGLRLTTFNQVPIKFSSIVLSSVKSERKKKCTFCWQSCFTVMQSVRLLWEGGFKWNPSSSCCFNNVALKFSSPIVIKHYWIIVSWIVSIMPRYFMLLLCISEVSR